MLVFFLIVVFAQIILTGIIGYRLIFMQVESILDSNTRELGQSLVQEINYVRGNFENHASVIMANPRVQDVLLNEFDGIPDVERYIEDQTEIGWILMDSGNRTSGILIGESSTYQSRASAYTYISHDEIITEEIYTRAQESAGAAVWVTLHEDIFTKRAEPTLYLCKAINLTRFDFKTLGHLIIRVPFDIFDDIFSRGELTDNEYYAVTDENGLIIFHSLDKELIGGQLGENLSFILDARQDMSRVVDTDDGSMMIYFSPFFSPAGRSGWNVIHAVPTTVPDTIVARIGNLAIGIMLALLVISLPLVFILLGSITRPILTLKNVVTDFGSALDTRATVNRNDEIGSLQESFNKMADDIEALLGNEVEINNQLRELELTALQHQINPHFLYNTLDSIYWMARENGSMNVAEMVKALAEYFRIGFGRKQETYHVKDEIEHIRQYLMLHKLRLKDRFEFNIDVSEDILDLPIIKIILQPIAENAVKYGIAKGGQNTVENTNGVKNRKGIIHVSGHKDEAYIIFTITDNGPGIPVERLKLINRSLEERDFSHESENGFGLYYVSQRLMLYYGEDAKILLENGKENGIVVTISIPANKTGDGSVSYSSR